LSHIVYSPLYTVVPACVVLWLIGTLLSVSAQAQTGWFEISRSIQPLNESLTHQGSDSMSELVSDDRTSVSERLTRRQLKGIQPSSELIALDIHERNATETHQPVVVHQDTAITKSHAMLNDKALLFSSSKSIPVQTTNLDMFVGEIKVLGPVDVTRVAIGNGDIFTAEVLDDGQLLIIAEMAGSSSLRLWHADGHQSDFNIRVSATDSQTRVRLEKMVQMQVRMVEFRRSALQNLGVNWSDAITGPELAVSGNLATNPNIRPPSDTATTPSSEVANSLSAYFGIASNISSRINLLVANGHATTLAEPMLSTVNGGSASFLAGGEVPYPTIGANGQSSVEFKEYGIKLTISPIIDTLNQIRTTVDTEISQLDPAVSVQGTPGLLTRRIQTHVNVGSGETIVLSGLLSSESGKDVDKVPGIGRLPVIGRFFRSSASRNSVSELVVFLTPTIVENSSGSLSDRHRRILTHSDGRLKKIRSKGLLLD